MDYFQINGGNRLKGKVRISGAKNAALPIMAATIMVEGETVLHGVPDLIDIRHMSMMLNKLGVATHRPENGSMHITVEDEMNCHAEYELVRQMRASVCLIGPLLAKRKKAQVALPGGCEPELAIGDGCGNQKRARLDAIGDDRVFAAVERGHPFDGDARRAVAGDLRAAGIQEIAQVGDLGFTGGGLS